MDVIVKGSPSIEIGFERKVVDSYKAVDTELSETSKNPVENAAITKALQKNKKETDSALATKANTTGYYPQMSVGQADNLPDRGDVTEGFIGFRESAGAGNSIEDGTANVQELLGESLVWNQKFDAAQGLSPTSNGITYTQDGYVFTANGTATSTSTSHSGANVKLVASHKYIVPIKTSDDVYVQIYDASNAFAYNSIFTAAHSANAIMRLRVVTGVTLTNYKFTLYLIDLTQMFGAGKEPTTVEEFNAIKNQLVGVDFNAYNEGEVLGVNIKGIKSVNDNAWDEEWEQGYISISNGSNADSGNNIRSANYIKVLPNTSYQLPHYLCDKYGQSGSTFISVLYFDDKKNLLSSKSFYTTRTQEEWIMTTPSDCHYIRFYTNIEGSTYNHDICIRLAHSGYKTDYVAHEESESSFDLTPYFPNGMHGINGVRDSVTKSKATKRFGVVKMKDLSWNYATTNRYFYTSVIEGMALAANAPIAILCNRYSPVIWSDFITNYTGNRNKMIAKADINNKARINILDDNFTSVESFVASLTDEDILIYELATPIEIEIDPQLNMNYKVWDFGTEELLTDSKSAPVLARTIYGFNATDTIRGNKAMNEEQEARIHTLESEVVRKGDYSPDNSVGFADDLVGRGESVPAEFSFRASGGKSIKDGTARIKRLKGNSVVWNQKFAPRDITTAGIASTYQNGKYHSVGTSTNNYFDLGLFQSNELNHIYLFIVEGLSPSFSGRFSLLNRNSKVTINNGYAYIFHNNTDTSKLRYIGFDQITVGEEIDETYSLVQYDLTQMFGAGNEPTTIEEFNARKPIVEDEYAYNEGEVIHMTAEGIKSVGDNAWDEEWESGTIEGQNGTHVPSDTMITTRNFIEVLPNQTYYFTQPKQKNIRVFRYDANKNYLNYGYTTSSYTIPLNVRYIKLVFEYPTYNNDIMITLVHSGWKQDTDAGYQPYWEDRLIFDQRIKDEFPDGMKSAGTAHDMAYNNMNKGVGVTENRIGVVDMGDLTFTEWQDGMYAANLADMAIRGQILCAKYNTDTYTNVTAQTMGIASLLDKGGIVLYDSAYTTPSAIKAAMAGVPLYYELAEPTIIEYDEPFNLDYRVADFGTEQMLTEQPSAPIAADIIYQFNAVDMIREHELEIAELQSIIATMQAQLASLTNKE